MIFADTVNRHKLYWTSVLIMVLCFSGYAVMEWLIVADYGVDFRNSSYLQTIGPIYFGGVMLVMPLCAALPSGFAQVDSLESGFSELSVFRCSVKQYTLRQFTLAFLKSGTAVGLAFAIHAIIWNIVATPCDTNLNDYLRLDYPEECIYYAWQPIFYSLPIYLWLTAAITFCGGVWGIVSITSVQYVPDRLMALVIPFCIYYLWAKGLPHVLLGVNGFPHPADLYNDALTWPMVGQSLIVYMCIIGVCFILYARKTKRRLS